jgi:hypothetical protein
MNRVLRYFDLRLDRPEEGLLRESGARARRRKQRRLLRQLEGALQNVVVYHIIVYMGVVLGVVGKVLFSLYTDGSAPSGPIVLISSIVAAVIFPRVSRDAGIDPDNPHPLQFFLAFQGGFFWQTLIGEIGRAAG